MSRLVVGLAACLAALAACGDDPPPDVVSFDMGGPPDACATCPEGATCNEGACACPEPLELCGDACVDVRSDVRHCGACDNACSSCADGACRCDGALTPCASPRGIVECTDVGSDPDHCGACGVRCPAGGSCAAGACSCLAGRTACDDGAGGEVCVDTATSVLHCGGCRAPCGVGFDCVDGSCACPTGRTACAGADGALRCADLANDDAHCGACGTACAATESCFAGRCEDDCPTGTLCTTAADCRNGEPAMLPATAGTTCLVEATESWTSGDASFDVTRWTGGYCLDHHGRAESAGSCYGDGRACAPCALCLPVGVDTTGSALFGCQRRCDPAVGDWATTRSGCRDGYQCSLEREVCVAGCTTDEECRGDWIDHDNDAVRDANELLPDPTSVARCDRVTGRCVDLPFDPDARFGDPCTLARHCPEDGACIPWPGGGHCVRYGCALEGRECGPGATCRPFGNLLGACFDDCVAGDETGDAMIGPSGGDPDCRVPGFRCYSIDGTATGACEPGNYNAVTEPNVGVPCTSSAECWSPYGNGHCFQLFGRGFCTVTQCGLSPFSADGRESTVCPPGTFCDGEADFYSHCVLACDRADPAACPEGFVCTSFGEPPLDGCFPRCRTDGDCIPEHRCTAEGECRRVP
ncbi:MAG: hypothetical protein IT379_10620 [Deltaproteobacteria bacterium]|nr:hypothetical protein [Deltaproteobacteria bacterium]